MQARVGKEEGLGKGSGWTSGMVLSVLPWAGTQAWPPMASRGPPRPGLICTGESLGGRFGQHMLLWDPL